jgi:hypothetical protein
MSMGPPRGTLSRLSVTEGVAIGGADSFFWPQPDASTPARPTPTTTVTGINANAEGRSIGERC